MPGKIEECRVLELPKVAESRGNLTFIEAGRHIRTGQSQLGLIRAPQQIAVPEFQRIPEARDFQLGSVNWRKAQTRGSRWPGSDLNVMETR